MMSYPIRGGSRGGQDSFSWENVKNDKYRENYLGHSINAPVGRWQKNKDLLWYDKSNEVNSESNINDELEEIKQKEAEAMAEFLGVSVPKKKRTEQISKKELQSIISKEEAEVEAENNVDNIKGVGFGSFGLNTSSNDNISFEDALKQKRNRENDESDAEDEKTKKLKKSNNEKEKSREKGTKEKKSHHHHHHHHKDRRSHDSKRRSSRSHSRHRRRNESRSPKRSSSSRHRHH